MLLTAALICSPVLSAASAASAPDTFFGAAQSDTVSIEAPGSDSGSSDPPPGDGDAQLGGSTASAAELGASQEGAWFLGQSVDSVLGPGQWYTAKEGRTWYGAYRTFSDRYSYCTDAGLKTPHPRFFRNAGAGKSITAARTAWALGTHRESSSAATHAALSALVRLDEAIPHRHAIPPGHPKDLGSDFAEAAQTYTTINRDAKRYAGPYTLDVTLRDRTIHALDAPAGEDPAASTGLVMDALVSLTSASGHEVPGHDVDVTVTGADPAQDRVTTGDDPTSVALLARGDAPITVEVEVDGLPSTEVTYHRPSGLGSDRVQAVVTPGEPVTLTAEDTWKQKERPPRPTLPPSPPPSPVPVPTATATYSPPPTTAPPTRSPEPSTTPEVTPPPATTPPPAPTRTPETPRTPEASKPPEAPETERPETEAPETEGPETEAPETAPPEETSPPEETAPPEDSAPPEETGPPQEDEQPGPPPQGGGEPPAPQEPSPPDSPMPAPDGPEPDTLPRTGVDATAAAGLALILVAVGTGALTLARRR